jgi:hypothetical protein
MQRSKVLTAAEQKVMVVVKDGQSGKYKGFIRSYTGRITQMVELKNPLTGGSIVYDIDRILEIINPALDAEIEWFKELQNAVKLWCNEKVIANRLLGLKNDNEYDMTVFENVVKEKFFLSGKPNPGVIVQTDFKTMVELVEMGARRFGNK